MGETTRWLVLVISFTFLMTTTALAHWTGDHGHALLVQVPYFGPPGTEPVPPNAVPPNTEPLTEQELARAEALLPLLSGNQELWAMGEFVHLGAPVVPVLVKALKMPDPRLRYNAIETMSMLKAPSAAPALVESAMEPNEVLRVREHALRVAVRLDPSVTVDAIRMMAQDSHDTIRKTAAFESRYVRDTAIIPILIELMKDEERYVAETAVQSLLRLTRYEAELHDWSISTPEDREQWAQEWTDWWAANKDTFEIPTQPSRRQPT